MKKKHWPIIAVLLMLPALLHCRPTKPPRVIPIDCEKLSVDKDNKYLAHVLKDLRSGITIQINGECKLKRPIVIANKRGITLTVGKRGGQIIGNKKQTALLVKDSTRITIEKLAVGEAHIGLQVEGRSNVRVLDSRFVGNDTGIVVGGRLSIPRGKKQLSSGGTTGFFRGAMAASPGLQFTSRTTIHNVTITKANNGLEVSRGAKVTITGTNQFNDNDLSGIVAIEASTITLKGATLEASENTKYGISINSSTVGIEPNSTFTTDGNEIGVVANNKGKIELDGASLSAKGNTETGISVIGSSEIVALGSTIDSLNNKNNSQNASTGILLDGGSNFYLEMGTTGESTGNSGLDVNVVDRNSYIECYDGSTLTRVTEGGQGNIYDCN